MDIPVESPQALPVAVVEIRLSEQEIEARRKELTSPSVAVKQSNTEGLKSQLELSGLRTRTLREAALAFSSQQALSWRYTHINTNVLDKYSTMWDRNFNFRPFVDKSMILLPSILQVGPIEYIENGRKQVTNVQFTIDEEAVIVANAPTFRDYLYKEFPAPNPVHPLLMPKDDEERKIWDDASKQGWVIGLQQAEVYFEEGLQEMLMDLEGRMTYRKMLDLNMVSPAALQVTPRGVTFNGRSMNVGEVIYEITDPVNFKNIDLWRSAWVKEEAKRK